MKVLVTGGAGFIGSHACRALVSAGHDVVAFDDLSSGSASNLEGSGVRLVEGTVLDGAALDAAAAGADAVLHLAARPSVSRSLADPIATHAANATGTLKVLDAVRRSRRDAYVVIASSSSVYGNNPALPKHEGLALMPASPYAASKVATEAYALAYKASFAVQTLTFRFFNVFGPAQPAGHAYAAVIPAFIDAALAGKPLTVEGDGRQTRDFTFVGTVVSVLVDAVTRRVVDDRPVNLAFGSRVSLLQLIGSLETIFGRELALDFAPARQGDVRDSQADATRLLELFPGITPVPLEAGLRETVDWFRQA